MISETYVELVRMERELLKKHAKALEELKKIESELDLVRHAKQLKRDKPSPLEAKYSAGGILSGDIPTVFNENMLQEKKVIMALNELNEANVREISEWMYKREGGKIDRDTSYKRAQQVIIKLVKENKVIKIGDYASKYKLNIK